MLGLHTPPVMCTRTLRALVATAESTLKSAHLCSPLPTRPSRLRCKACADLSARQMPLNAAASVGTRGHCCAGLWLCNWRAPLPSDGIRRNKSAAKQGLYVHHAQSLPYLVRRDRLGAAFGPPAGAENAKSASGRGQAA